MKRAWIALALLSGSWLWGLHYYHAPNPWVWAALAVGGALLLIGTTGPLTGRRTAVVAAVLLIPAVVIAGWPYRLGPLLMIAGLVLHTLPAPRRWPGRLGAAIALAGVVLVVQSLSLEVYASLTARSHELPRPVAEGLGGFARLLGAEVAVDGTDLVLFSMRRKHAIGATWELLVDPVTLCLLVGAAAWLAIRAWSAPAAGRPAYWRAGAWVLGAVVLWLPVRTALLLGVYLHRVLRTEYGQVLDAMNQFWSPWVHLGLLLPPVLLAWRFYHPRPTASAAPTSQRPAPAWRPVAAGAAALLAAAALSLSILWHPVGPRKAGRVLVDDLRSQQYWPSKEFDTTRTDKPFDTTWYGHASGYNYACIYDYCSRFYDMSRLNGLMTEELLCDGDDLRYDVLLLKVPSTPFSDREIAAIRAFVERGGGLLMFGEHTSVYGSGVHLNRVARTFGFEFRDDCLFGIESIFEQTYHPPAVPHPVVQHFPTMRFAISCSVRPFGRGTAVARDTGLKNLHANYHATNAYPQARNQPQMRYGAFVQIWGTTWGAGRVLAFTDSTIFANFSTFEPGKSELMLSMLEWVNHREPAGPWTAMLAVLGVALAVAALALAWPWASTWLVVVAAAVAGWGGGSIAARTLNRLAMPLPPPQRPMVRVAMDRTVSGGRLPRNGFISGKKDMFGQFERSVLRLGLFTNRSAGADVTDSQVVIVLFPNQDVPTSFRDRLAAYVDDGGHLLVLDGPENPEPSTANRLLYPYELELGDAVLRPDRRAYQGGPLSVPEGWPAIEVGSAKTVKGGVPLAYLAGRPVAAAARHGEGTVTVIGFGSRFTDYQMGIVADVIPEGKLRNVFEFEYALLRAIVANAMAPPEATTAAGSHP